MSQVAELKKLVKSLQSAQVGEAIVEILSALRKQPNINEAVLRVSHPPPSSERNTPLTPSYPTRPQESKAGLAVGKLRSHADKRVSEAASTSKPGACLAIAGFLQTLTSLCSAEETSRLDGHFVKGHPCSAIRLFPCNPKNRNTDRQR